MPLTAPTARDLQSRNDRPASVGHRTPGNTVLARKLAKLWEEWTGQDFPGGVENAWIHREYPGKDQRSQGAMSWSLYTIGPGRPTPVRWAHLHDETTNCLLYAGFLDDV